MNKQDKKEFLYRYADLLSNRYTTHLFYDAIEESINEFIENETRKSN